MRKLTDGEREILDDLNWDEGRQPEPEDDEEFQQEFWSEEEGEQQAPEDEDDQTPADENEPPF